MICNLPTDFLHAYRGSTNLVIHRRLAKILDKWPVWLECDFLKKLAIFFIFWMPTQSVAKEFSWLEMLVIVKEVTQITHISRIFKY